MPFGQPVTVSPSACGRAKGVKGRPCWCFAIPSSLLTLLIFGDCEREGILRTPTSLCDIRGDMGVVFQPHNNCRLLVEGPVFLGLTLTHRSPLTRQYLCNTLSTAPNHSCRAMLLLTLPPVSTLGLSKQKQKQGARVVCSRVSPRSKGYFEFPMCENAGEQTTIKYDFL